MIKDQSLVKQMLEMINTTIEAAEYLYNSFKNFNYNNFIQVANDIEDVINIIYNKIINIKKQENIIIKVDLACENANYSLARIKSFFKSRSKKTLEKIKFELIPILEDMYLQLYFFGSIYPDKTKIYDYYNNERIQLSSNKYIDKSELRGKYKYDLSIIVLGYNKLDYTKLCIDSLLKYIPDNINYELILVNHGSTDGTKAYFEEISPTKQIDILRNGGSPSLVIRIVEGKYTMLVSNDIIVTENAIANMIKCMESDDDIAWVVPSTPNVSNHQAIPAKYNNLDEMHEFSKLNNISNPYRWEQRARLCNPIDLRRSSVWYSSKGIGLSSYFHTTTAMSFPDDKASMILRRNGYKLMLAKDAYCYHFGSVTLKDENNKYKNDNGKTGSQAFYEDGRRQFKEIFGIDPWSTGICFDPILFDYLKCSDKDHVDILGINCGMGSNPLKVKESIKENANNLDVMIYNVTDEKCYIEDLKGVSDEVKYINNELEIETAFENKMFNYIIVESGLDRFLEPLKLLQNLKMRTLDDGVICIKLYDKLMKEEIKNIYPEAIEVGAWIVLE